MGRPLKKSRFSDLSTPEGTAGKIEVTAYYPTGGSLQQDDDSFIISQRSSRKFKIHQQNDSTDQVLTLKAVAPASLAEGEFCVKVLLDDSTVAYVAKFFNNIVHYVTAAGATGSAKYSLGSAAAEDTVVSGSVVIDVV
jgi:hypothetical protein